jgi:hypothetical protein
MTDLYISYSTRERYWVSQLVSALKSDGYSVSWEHVAVLGDDVRPDSQTALAAAKHVLAIWSPLAVEDHWVLQDAKQAQELGKLLSVFYKEAELPPAFTTASVVNLKHWRSADIEDAAYVAFITALKLIIKPSGQGEAQRKQALKDRKQRMQAEKQRRQGVSRVPDDKARQLRASV